MEGWSDLKRDIKLENAWVFANEDALAGSIKAFLDFEKKLLEPIPKAERANVKLTEITGAAAAAAWGTPHRSVTECQRPCLLPGAPGNPASLCCAESGSPHPVAIDWNVSSRAVAWYVRHRCEASGKRACVHGS